MNGEQDRLIYAGFWIRTVAACADGLLSFLIWAALLLVASLAMGLWPNSAQFLTAVDPYADAVLLLWPVVILLFWLGWQATPGKMLISARIVDARTGARPTPGQCIVRWLGYLPSTLCLGLGFIWIGIDVRRQGWHDKLAGTVVIQELRSLPVPGEWASAAGENDTGPPAP